MAEMTMTGAACAAPLILNDIKAPEVFQMVRIMKILGFNEIGSLADQKTRRDLSYTPPKQQKQGGVLEDLPRELWTEAQVEAETRYQIALSGIVMKVMGLIIERIGNPEFENAVYSLLAYGTGTDVARIRKLDAVDFIDLLDRYISREGFSDFFMQAWKLFARSGKKNSQISAIAATVIRQV